MKRAIIAVLAVALLLFARSYELRTNAGHDVEPINWALSTIVLLAGLVLLFWREPGER